jgi:CRP/FNR family cyclic AMP-dependent transcriptional regulator
MNINILKNIDIFSDLSPDEIKDFLASAQKKMYSHGSIVIQRGDVGDIIYLILKGRVKVVLTHIEGREIILNVMKTGDYFGEMSVFDYMLRSATIIAEEDSEFLMISREALTNEIRKNPKIALKMLSNMSNKVREMNEQVNCLTNLDAKGRVAKTLLKLSKKAGVRIENGSHIIPRPLERDIADMSGTSRETVSRILTELKKNGIIGLSKEHIVIYEELETNCKIV